MIKHKQEGTQRPQYRALMLREEARRLLDEARWEFEKVNGYCPTYSMFITMLLEGYPRGGKQ